MEVDFTPEAQLAHIAHQAGTDSVHLVKDAALRVIEDVRFREAVLRGEAALERGDYFTHEQVGERITRLFSS